MASLWLAGRFVHALLFAQADERVAIWASGATPFDVDFSNSDALIQAGSTGIDNAVRDAEGLSLSSSGEPIALALRLPRGGLMQSRLASVTLDGKASAPVAWQLIGFSPAAQHMATIASGRLEPGSNPSASEIDATDWPIRALQLRLESDDNASLSLSSLRFAPDFQPEWKHRCPYAEAVSANHTQPLCGVRVALPGSDGVSDLLLHVDESEIQLPGLAIEPAWPSGRLEKAVHGAMTVWLRFTRGEAGTLAIYGMVISLSMLALVLAVRAPGTSHRFSVAALLLIIAALILPASGLPDDIARPSLVAVFGLWAASAILLGSRSRPLHWIGDIGAWRSALFFTLAGCGLLLLLDDSVWHSQTFNAALRYLPWVALQQWLLQRLIRPMAESWTNDRVVAISGSALCFGLLHFPNPALMLFSALAAAGWCWLAQRHRALLPLILSHWLLGLAALTLLSPTLLRNAEIGSRFLLQR